MAIHVIAYVREKGTGARDEPPRQSRHIEVDADDYESAKAAVRRQLPDGWMVGSWRVEPSAQTAS